MLLNHTALFLFLLRTSVFVCVCLCVFVIEHNLKNSRHLLIRGCWRSQFFDSYCVLCMV